MLGKCSNFCGDSASRLSVKEIMGLTAFYNLANNPTPHSASPEGFTGFLAAIAFSNSQIL
ncbi:hypothetical protein HCH_06130 [Hahella chejuensis KCTC 2396]|uniref:Uncharacterized protein n=1 Tax=Hahella chejuensis (strain KCTC 2396) TaxID=349521 RepID=Q2S995_HAHCH|nr:hypothetical protein HCH_06130 [Hahella chejuensis KCTC 2396]